MYMLTNATKTMHFREPSETPPEVIAQYATLIQMTRNDLASALASAMQIALEDFVK